MNNHITKYIHHITKSEMYDKTDFIELFNNSAGYYPNLICDKLDFNLFNALKDELANDNKIQWASNRHHIYDDPLKYPTFNFLVNKLTNIFNIKVSECRLNYYENGMSYKNLHQDRIIDTQNYTIGLSLGNTRDLMFQHIINKQDFKFPQFNGDVFCFNDIINQTFYHGIPKSSQLGDRISIILWGKINLDYTNNIDNIYNKDNIIKTQKKLRWRKK